MAFDAGAIIASITVDRSDFTRGIAAARSEGAKGISVPVNFDISQQSVTRALAAAKRLFAASPVAVAVSFNISQPSVNRAIAASKKMFAASPVAVPVTFGINQASVTRAQSAAKTLFAAKPVTVPVEFSVSAGAVNRALAAAKTLFAARPLVVPVSFAVAAASVAKTVLAAKALFAAIPLNVQVNFSTPGAAGAAAAAGAVAGATNAASAAGRGAYGVYGLLTKQLTLFGGALEFTHVHMLNYVSVLHLGIDWVIEFSAVLIPAAIALSAFGVAAAGTLVSIYQHMKDVEIVSTATGQAIAPLSGGFAKLQAAVKPQVYQLFGDALTLMSQRGGAFAKIATSTGSALDYLGARMTVAITQGKGVGGVMAAGADDVAKLGAVVGNLGGAMGNLLKAMPGFAEVFLNLWVVVSKGAEVITSVTVPIINFALTLHGLIIYGGLAVTAVLALRAPLTALAVGAVKAGVSVVALGAEMLSAAAAGDVFGAAMLLIDATGGPLVWITTAVVALGALVVWMLNAKTAAQQWNASMQKTIDNAPTIVAGVNDVANAIAATSVRLADSQKTLSQTTETSTQYVNRYGQAVTGMTKAYQTTSNATDTYRSGLQQLNAEQAQSNTRLATLGKTYGGTTAALGLLTTAGITEKEWQDKSANGWAIIQQQLTATSAAYKVMGVAGGAVGNDLQILGNQALATTTAIQSLNTGLDTFIGDVTKTQGSFDTLALGNVTLAQNFSKANEAAATTKHTLDGVTAASNLSGAAMDGLSQASLTLNQAFGTQVTNVNALLDTWRQAGVAQNLQTQGTKDAIAPLLKYAKGSREATAQLVALAEEAGYNGPAAMKNLTAWLGNTSGATKKVKDITNQATIQEALLTTSMKAQGAYIANSLIGDINSAILKYNGVATAAKNYGNAVAESGRQSDAAHQARATLISDIIKTGVSMHSTTAQTAALITKVLGIPPKKAIALVVSGTGSYSVTDQSLATKLGAKNLPKQLPPPNKAAGGVITGGTPGKDSVLINAMPGEVVVPTRMVNAGAVDHLRGRLPGFAAGGVVGSYSGTPSGAGAFAVTEYNATITAMEKSVAGATASAAAAAQKTAQAAASIAGATTSAIGDLPANYRVIASFLTAHGYSNAAAAGMAGNMLQECVTIDTMILTKRGWLKHDEVQSGDETIGYNRETGLSEWTRITAVQHYADRPIVRFGNQFWSAEFTTNHRFLMDEVRSSTIGLQDDLTLQEALQCPECGATAGTRKPFTNMRSVQIHRSKIHGVKSDRRREIVGARDLVKFEDMTPRHRLVLAVAAETGDGLPVSLREAALLGWIAGDGSVRRQHENSLSVSIWQSKEQFFGNIDDACSEDPNHVRYPLRPGRKAHHKPSIEWHLSSVYARDLIARAGDPKADVIQIVLTMSAPQRAAWLEAIRMAEGTSSGSRIRYWQDAGQIADAIELAVYLEGHRPGRYERLRAGKGRVTIEQASPYIGGPCRNSFTEDAGSGDVWCVTTELGSWTASSPTGGIFLTGNSGGNPESVGDGGGGLIGFTPLRPGYVTGNPGRDLATQLNGVLSYNQGWSQYIGGLNAQSTPAAAAAYYMQYFERPAVATENAERREAGANAVFKAMGYAGGTGGAKPGWAKVGEHGQELVRFSGGETVLPAHVTSRVMSGSLNLPGYAGGTGIIKDPNPVSGFGGVNGIIKNPNPVSPFAAAQRAKDEQQLKKDQDALKALVKKVTGRLKDLRIPLDRDNLKLLEHPGMPKAQKTALRQSIDKQEAAIKKYRDTATSDEGNLQKEIDLLKKIIASEPAAPAGKAGAPGILPPGINGASQKQLLAELAKDVTALSALKKKAAGALKVLQIPVNQDELYLLQHPNLPASSKAALKKSLSSAEAVVKKYRTTTDKQETTLSDEITLLRSLTGNPAAKQYGGAGTTSSSSGGGSGGGGGGSSTTPPGQFVGTLPAPPGEGGALPSGGGTGGLGGSTGASPGAPVTAAGGSAVMSPGDSFAIASGIPSGAAASGWGITPAASQPGAGSAADPLAAATAAMMAGGSSSMGGQDIAQILNQILAATRGSAAQSGAAFGQTLNGTARAAAASARWGV